jgi:hypothetical protein
MEAHFPAHGLADVIMILHTKTQVIFTIKAFTSGNETLLDGISLAGNLGSPSRSPSHLAPGRSVDCQAVVYKPGKGSCLCFTSIWEHRKGSSD